MTCQRTDAHAIADCDNYRTPHTPNAREWSGDQDEPLTVTDRRIPPNAILARLLEDAPPPTRDELLAARHDGADDFDERGSGPNRYPEILRDESGRPVDVG